MTLVSSMNMAQQALAVNQSALTVVSNNIANMDTDGYSKLRVNLGSLSSTYDSPSQSPLLKANSYNGVTIENIKRYSNSYLQGYYDQENSSQSYLDKYSSIASDLQSITTQLNDTGLSTALSKFYTAVNTLNKDPSDITARTNYVSAAQTLCAVFNSTSGSLSTLQKTLVGDVSSNSASEIVSETANLNSLIDQLGDVNQNIVKTNTTDGTSSSSLLDKRDLLITQISSLANVTTKENKDGTMSVYLGNTKLVDDTQVVGHLNMTNSTDVSGNLVVTASVVDPKNSAVVLNANVNSDLTGGSISAIMDACGTDPNKLTISGILGNLDNMASEFSTVINSIQLNADYPVVNGTPMCIDSATMKLTTSTTSMFVDSSTGLTTGITAANISVNSAIISDPYKVAAARLTDTTQINDVGNNSNVTLITAARSDSSYYTTLGSVTPEEYLANTASTAGARISNINSNLATQTSVLDAIKTKLSAQTGVNMDEELTDMIKYQRAYQAAARVFSACSDLLDTLVNLGK